MRIPRPTYTSVTATAALFIALGGSSYAAATITGANLRNGTVTGADIKNGSVKGRDVADGSLTGADLADGSLTGTGVAAGSLARAHFSGGLQAGPAGPAGPRGSAGPGGSTDVVTRRAVDIVLQRGEGERPTASCAAGEIAIGGGAGHSGTPGDLVAIAFAEPLEADGSPPEDGEPATGWRATGFHYHGSSDPAVTMTLHVLCAVR
jgi:hypothetical protein